MTTQRLPVRQAFDNVTDSLTTFSKRVVISGTPCVFSVGKCYIFGVALKSEW